MNYKCYIFLLLASFSLHLFGRESELNISIDSDLNKKRYSLSADTYFYHYFELNISESIIKDSYYRSLIATNRIKNQSRQFWNLKNNRTEFAVAGLGLYMASDPFISSPAASEYSRYNYGSSMIEVTLPKGLVFLDLTKPIELSKQTIRLLLESNILTKKGVKYLLTKGRFSQRTLRYMVEPRFYVFRQFMNDYFRRNNISTVEYRWFSALSIFCDKPRMQSAMVYIGANGKLIDFISSQLIYWPMKKNILNLSTIESISYRRNEKLMNVLKKLKNFEKKIQFKQGRKFLSEAYSNTEELRGIRDKIFNCSKNLYQK